MTEGQGDNPEYNAEDSIIPPESTSEYVDDVVYEEQQPTSETQNTHNPPCAPPINDKKENKMKRIPYLEIGTFLINAFLAYFTYQLFKETQKSTKAAVDSAAEAKRANDMTSDAMLENSRRQRTVDSLDSIIRHDDKAFQVRSEGRAMKEYVATNQPYVIMDTFAVRKFRPGEKVDVSISFKNLGKSPAYLKMYRRSIRFITEDFKSFDSIQYTHSDSASVITFLGSMQEKKMYAASEKPITDEEYSKFSRKVFGMWIYGEVQYNNITTNRINSCRFSVIAFIDGTYAYTDQHNGIVELPSKNR